MKLTTTVYDYMFTFTEVEESFSSSSRVSAVSEPITDIKECTDDELEALAKFILNELQSRN